MAESSLSLGYADLCKEIAWSLGYGMKAYSALTADELALVESVLNAALRKFYYPLLEEEPYGWSFLHPTTTLTTVADDYDYTLPDGIANVEGDLTYATDDSTSMILQKVSEAQIRAWRMGGTSSGRPTHYAVRPRTATGGAGQKWEVLLFPTPNAEYTLSYQGEMIPNKLTASAPYPLGGGRHSETILALCQAEVESRVHGMPAGPMLRNALERLKASVLLDRRLGESYVLGADNRVYPQARVEDVKWNGVVPA